MLKDCYGNRGTERCIVLNENLCEKQGGHCSFYATREKLVEDRERASNALKAKGLYPCTKSTIIDGVSVDIQTVARV